MSNNRLYHCVNKPIEGDSLLPTCERTVNGKEGSYLFAADRFTKALAFAFSYYDKEVMFNCNLDDGSSNECIVLSGGQHTLDKPRHVKVLSFSNEGFEQMGGSCQWVSKQAMPLEETMEVLETHSINTLMERGLQIFLMDEDGDALDKEGFLDAYLSQENPIQRLHSEGRTRWINQERGINPCPSLQNQLKPTNNSCPAIKPDSTPQP